MEPRRAESGETRPNFADHLKESDVRATDGRGGRGREPEASAGSGERQPGSAGDRPDEDDTTGETSSGALGQDPSEAAGRGLGAESGEAGRDTEAKRRDEETGNTDGGGSNDSADVAASADTDLRTVVQRAQLWISTGAQRTGRCASRTEICAGREGLGGGFRHHEVLRPSQSRHTDGTDREGDPGQTGVAFDREVPAAGSDGGRDGGSQRGGHAARRAVVAAFGQHLSGCTGSGAGTERA